MPKPPVKPPLPEIKLNGHREYWGREQLTDAETILYSRIKRFGLQLAFTAKGPVYLVHGQKVHAQTARYLIDHRFVLPESGALSFSEAPA